MATECLKRGWYDRRTECVILCDFSEFKVRFEQPHVPRGCCIGQPRPRVRPAGAQLDSCCLLSTGAGLGAGVCSVLGCSDSELAGVSCAVLRSGRGWA